MEQPPGFVHSNISSYVFILHKSLYGLKQAPRVWYNCLSDYLLFIGSHASRVNMSLFILSLRGDVLYLLVYVDGLLLTGSNLALLKNLISLLSLDFKLHGLRSLYNFLGIKLNVLLWISCLLNRSMLLTFFYRASMSFYKPIDTPASFSSKMTMVSDTLYYDSTRYIHIIGAL